MMVTSFCVTLVPSPYSQEEKDKKPGLNREEKSLRHDAMVAKFLGLT